MTTKKENIINAALQLFAEEGYGSTSTSKVAKAAGVSEGLIFRHFENKEGLLKAIIEIGEEKIKNLFSNIIFQSDPKEIIRNALTMPLTVIESEYGFWRLQYKLKWELKEYNNQRMEPLKISLAEAFKKLGYKNPEQEAVLVLMIVDGLASSLLKGTLKDKKEFSKFLLNKYNL